jgi:transcriptional regulator with XRE-family HTH domain
MKRQKEFVALLKSRLLDAVSKNKPNYSELSRLTNIDASQVSRICRGEFSTNSPNVRIICKALGLEGDTAIQPIETADERRLREGILGLWTKTPGDADRLVRLLNDLSELRKPAKADEK